MPGQRKVMFTCLLQKSAHHGEASLMGTIIGLAQNFVGSNNLHLLMPIG